MNNFLIFLRSNILSNMSNKYIHECRYNKISDQLCPVFSIKQILEDAEFNSFESLKVLKKVVSLLRLKYFKSLNFIKYLKI
jgi:hypothetical protein